MIDLFLLCTDLKNTQSALRQGSNKIIKDIYKFLNKPTEKTREIIEEWKEQFRYIYGDVDTNLSSNSKLKPDCVLNTYGIDYTKNIPMHTQVQQLFFSIQTYFSILIKTIMKEILVGAEVEDFAGVLLGKFAKKYGIINYCSEDWYCWPLGELEQGFDEIMTAITDSVAAYRTQISVKEFVQNNNYDYIKQMYEAVIPKELRHALGEYYTPDWLAEITLQDAFSLNEEKDIKNLVLLDPTCGSGTFLFKSIAAKRKENCNLQEIVHTVWGLDINPLAILTAKTNYILSILDLLSSEEEWEIPVYKMDILKLSEKREILQKLPKADIVIGNPPWVNWEYMPEQYRVSSQQLWVDYKLFSAKGRDLSFSKEDISVLITYIVMDKLLKTGGILAFVIRQGVFKSAQNGVGFRRFQIRDDCGIKVLRVDDLSKIKAFDNATTSAALFFARKGEETIYPVPYYLWEKRSDLAKCSFQPYSELKEVLSQLQITAQCAMPTVESDVTSLWFTTEKENLNRISKVLGTNGYRARTGVFTGGANAVYWLKVEGSAGDKIKATNVVERAKRKAEKVFVELEKDYIYPMLKGSNVRKWSVSYDTYLLCPHTAETKMWPVSKTVLQEKCPNTYQYLSNFKEDLDGRKGFAGWEKEIQQKEFHAILRVGEYTFSKYKVIWKYIASEFVCAVIGSVEDAFLGEKMLLPNEKIMYVSMDSEEEAYYLCGVLSSTLVAGCVKSYMNPTSISAHVLNKLNIPKYDAENVVHQRIAAVCKKGHGKEDLKPYLREIDKLVLQIYDTSKEEKKDGI